MLRAVQGFAAASFAPVALAYLAESVPPARRALAFGAISTAFLAAGITGQVFASAVALALGWSWVFVLYGGALIACLAGIVGLVVEPRFNTVAGGFFHRFVDLGKVALMPRVLLLALAHLTLLLGFVGMYTALGSHLTTLGSDDSQVIWFRLVGLPGMFASLAVGPLTRRLGVSGVARLGFTIATAGLAAEALLSGSLVAISMTSLVYVAGVALAIPAMIAAFGETAAPNRAGGMALNGFVLFVGASVGPLIAGLPLPFPILLLCFAGFSALAVVSLTVYSGLDRRREALL